MNQNRKLDSMKSTLLVKESQVKEAKLRLDNVEEKQNYAHLLKMKLATDITTYENIRKRLVPGEEFMVAKIEKETNCLKQNKESKLIKSQNSSKTFKDVENQAAENAKHLTVISDLIKNIN